MITVYSAPLPTTEAILTLLSPQTSNIMLGPTAATAPRLEELPTKIGFCLLLYYTDWAVYLMQSVLVGGFHCHVIVKPL